jgi:tetratricopeptide (TPR) repeat protein
MTKTGASATPTPDDHAQSFFDSVRAHSRLVSVAAIVVVAAGLLGWVVRTASEKKEVNASRTLTEAERTFGSGNLPLAQSDLERMLTRYDGTTAAIQARLLLAQVYFDQQKPSEGLKVLDAIRDPGPLETSYHAVRAGGLEQAQKPADAASEYEKAAQSALSDNQKAAYLADAARTYEAAGRTDEARRLWKQMAEDEDSPLSGQARVRLGELEAKAVSGG